MHKRMIALCLFIETIDLFAQNLPKRNVQEEKISQEKEERVKEVSENIFGTDPNSKFSFYHPTYFLFGLDDLKLQFSAKYRLSKSSNLYLAYTQLMFWNIYQSSHPFEDINYNPELFYRIIERDQGALRSIDIGHEHSSNGEDNDESRSLNLIYLKANFHKTFSRNSIIGEFRTHYIYNQDASSQNIDQHMGRWDLRLYFTNLLIIKKGNIDLELKFFAGKDIIDFKQGGQQVGLVYNLGSNNFNPNIYFQYYHGYAEGLLHQDKEKSEARLGLMLNY